MRIFARGIGAVSPAGWGVPALRDALAKGEALPTLVEDRPLWRKPRRYRTPPELKPAPAFFSHPRFRRASPISAHAIAAAQEAIGGEDCKRLGFVFSVMAGCVNYSRRFYDETLKDPKTASPMVFAETVFNAPSSHIAALLGSPEINYTILGDQGVFLQGLAMAADWLASGRVDGCVVLGAEEMDWLLIDAFYMFSRHSIIATGAGALYLKAGRDDQEGIELNAITSAHCFHRGQSRAQALEKARAELPIANSDELLCDSLQGIARLDRDEVSVWGDWKGPRISPKKILGEAAAASSAWQCVAAIDALQQGERGAAIVNVAGSNEQAVAARFVRRRAI